MTPANDHSENRRIAEAARTIDTQLPEWWKPLEQFHKRFDPPRVLTMIDEIEALRKCSTCGGDPLSHASKIYCVCEDGSSRGEIAGLRRVLHDSGRAADLMTKERDELADQVRVLKEWIDAQDKRIAELEAFIAAPALRMWVRMADRILAAKDAPANVKE